MIQLAFPSYDFKINNDPNGAKIFDIIRRKYVALTPEEWVRQHLIHYLSKERNVPISLMSVEKTLKVNGLNRRTDILVYSRSLKPVLLAECKSSATPINQAVFDQAARYNLTLDVNYFVLSNGNQTLCCIMNKEEKKYDFLEEIPDYEQMMR